MNINNVSLSDYNKSYLPKPQIQLKLVNVALQVQRDTTVGLLEKSTQLLDIYA